MGWFSEGTGPRLLQGVKTLLLGAPYLLVRPAVVAFTMSVGVEALGGSEVDQVACGAVGFSAILYGELRTRLPAIWDFFSPVERQQSPGYFQLLSAHPVIGALVCASGVVFVHNTYLGMHALLDWLGQDGQAMLISFGVYSAISHVIVFLSFGGKKAMMAGGMVVRMLGGDQGLRQKFNYGAIAGRETKAVFMCGLGLVSSLIFFDFATHETLKLLPWSKGYSDRVMTVFSVLGAVGMMGGITLAKGFRAYLWLGREGLNVHWTGLSMRQRAGLVLDCLAIGLLVPSLGMVYFGSTSSTLRRWGASSAMADWGGLPVAVSGMALEWPYTASMILESWHVEQPAARPEVEMGQDAKSVPLLEAYEEQSPEPEEQPSLTA